MVVSVGSRVWRGGGQKETAMSKQDQKSQASRDSKEEGQELTVGQRMASTLRKHRVKYEPVKAYSGKPSLDNADTVAKALRGKTPAEVMALAERVLQGVEKGELTKKYGHLNPGQQRMNAGNLIRNAVKRGELKVKDLK
jgi:hypothetical protein